MTELKPLSDCCNAEVYFHSGGGGLENRNECSKCGQRCHYHSVPQSFTEKVKWPERRTEDVQKVGWTNSSINAGWNQAIEACKQSLNQASQEDRDKVIEMLGEVLIKYASTVPHCPPKAVMLADAILKEYILVRREK